jgi:hypothetical protein
VSNYCWICEISGSHDGEYEDLSRGYQTVGLASQGAPLVLKGGRVYCMRDIFILNEMWVKGKIYNFDRHFAWFNYFTYLLVSALAPNNKQHIFPPAKARKIRSLIY